MRARSWASKRCRNAFWATPLLVSGTIFATCLAEERVLPVPRGVIYPGDAIRESMIEEKNFPTGTSPEGSVIESRNALLGKVARRTLLPGKPIATIAVDAPKLVTVGARVKIVFEEGGLVITTYGQALQNGAVGDVIRIRNQESGLVISGSVQPDGSVRVSEG